MHRGVAVMYAGHYLSIVRSVALSNAVIFDPSAELRRVKTQVMLEDPDRRDLVAQQDQRVGISQYGAGTIMQIEAILASGVNVAVMPWTYRVHDSYIQLPYPRSMVWIREDFRFVDPKKEEDRLRVSGQTYRMLKDFGVIDIEGIKKLEDRVMPLCYEASGPALSFDVESWIVSAAELKHANVLLLKRAVDEGLTVLSSYEDLGSLAYIYSVTGYDPSFISSKVSIVSSRLKAHLKQATGKQGVLALRGGKNHLIALRSELPFILL